MLYQYLHFALQLQVFGRKRIGLCKGPSHSFLQFIPSNKSDLYSSGDCVVWSKVNMGLWFTR